MVAVALGLRRTRRKRDLGKAFVKVLDQYGRQGCNKQRCQLADEDGDCLVYDGDVFSPRSPVPTSVFSQEERKSVFKVP